MARKILLDWQEIQSVSLDDKRILALTDVGALIFMACSDLYRNRSHWRFGEEDVTDEQWDDIEKAIGNAETEIMSSLIGVILPHVRGSLVGLKMLPCEGSIYTREEYPLLYEAIDDEFKIDADTFRVPDLRDKFPLAAGDNYPIGTEGGEETHTLNVGEMPSHTHFVDDHFHTTAIPVASVGAAITGVPVPSAVVGIGATDYASITIETAGFGEEHNNMPPFVAIRWAIVAG